MPEELPATMPQTGRTISLSEKARTTLRILTSEIAGAELDIPPFASATEAIRFACMLGIRVHGDTLVPLADSKEANAETLINIGSLDTDGAVSFIEVVSLLAPEAVKTEKLTRVVRRYTEWGLAQIQTWLETVDPDEGDLTVATMIEKGEVLIKEANSPGGA